MFEALKNYFRGSVWRQSNTRTQIFPVGQGRRINVDANGDLIYSTCIEILARQLAQNEWGLYAKGNDEAGGLAAKYHRALNLEPYPGISAYDFWEYMEKMRLGHGNAYAYIHFDEKTTVLDRLIPLDPAGMHVYWDNANILEGKRKIIYEYRDTVSGENFLFLPEEILHLKSFSRNGIVGVPAIDVLMSTLRSNAEVESALRTSVENGFSGTIVLSYTSDLSREKQKLLQDGVKEMLRSADNTILPLPAGMSAQNISNDIKSYFDTLKTTNSQAISSFFGIPLAMLNIVGGAGMATFSTNQMMSFYNHTIIPIIKRYSIELTVKLLTEKQSVKGYRFKTSNDVFDFLDAQAKASVLSAYTGAGILTANEARASITYPRSDDPNADKLTQRGGTGALGDSANDEGGKEGENNGIG